MAVRTRRDQTRHSRAAPQAVVAAILFALLAIGFATAQSAAWELRVCAQPHSWPVSSRENGGFNIDIAHILADELGASVSFEWTPLNDRRIRETLLAGACDVVIGVGEGAGGVRSTVPYVRLPYVFVTRADQQLEIESLDDPQLREVRIGTYPSGVPAIALEGRGIEKNVVEFAPTTTEGGTDRDSVILDALINGEIDVAIVFDPAAAGRQAQTDTRLRIAQVRPEIDAGPNLLQLFRTWTIGVRPHDEALSDRLNTVLAARWSDIQSIIEDYGLHGLELQAPTAGAAASTPAIAFIAPMDSGGVVPLQDLGMSAFHGVQFAESVIARDPMLRDAQVRVLYASAPTDEAAVRAAQRVVATEPIFSIVGGYSAKQIAEIGRISYESGILFFNVGSTDDSARGDACLRTSFHIEASAAMYMDGIVDWYLGQGARRFFAVHLNQESHHDLVNHMASRLANWASDASLVGRHAVGRDELVFTSAIEAALSENPDVLVMLLEPDGQALFVSQFPSGERTIVTGLPQPLTQTRPFLHHLREVATNVGRAPRLALWEASLDDRGAGELNADFVARTGAAMQPAAWASYAAVYLLAVMYRSVTEPSTDAFISFLESESATFDVGKETDVSFREWNHQLRQELYVVQALPDAPLGRRAEDWVSFATALSTVPASSSASDRDRLDLYGYSAQASDCRY